MQLWVDWSIFYKNCQLDECKGVKTLWPSWSSYVWIVLVLHSWIKISADVTNNVTSLVSFASHVAHHNLQNTWITIFFILKMYSCFSNDHIFYTYFKAKTGNIILVVSDLCIKLCYQQWTVLKWCHWFLWKLPGNARMIPDIHLWLKPWSNLTTSQQLWVPWCPYTLDPEFIQIVKTLFGLIIIQQIYSVLF